MEPPAGFQNYYAILGIPNGVDAIRLTTAWISMAIEYHPEHVRGRENGALLLPRAEERFRLMALSYNILINPVLRETYDAFINPLEHCTVEAVDDEAALHQMTDLDWDETYKPCTPTTCQRLADSARHSADSVSEWFDTYMTSSGSASIPPLRADNDWAIKRIGQGASIVDGMAREVLLAVGRLKQAEVQRKGPKVSGSPYDAVRALLWENNLPRNWAVPVYAGIVTPAMQRVDNESKVLETLFPGSKATTDFTPSLDIFNVNSIPEGLPAYLSPLPPPTPVAATTPSTPQFLAGLRDWLGRKDTKHMRAVSEPIVATTVTIPPAVTAHHLHDRHFEIPQIQEQYPLPARGRFIEVEGMSWELVTPASSQRSLSVRQESLADSSLSLAAPVGSPTQTRSSVDYNGQAQSVPTRQPRVVRPVPPLAPITTTWLHRRHAAALTSIASMDDGDVEDRNDPSSLIGNGPGTVAPLIPEDLNTPARHHVSEQIADEPGTATTPSPSPATPTGRFMRFSSPPNPRPKPAAALHSPKAAMISKPIKVDFSVRDETLRMIKTASPVEPSPAKPQAPGPNYLEAGTPAPEFIAMFAEQWAENTPRAITPAFRVVDRKDLAAGSYCRGWGVYLHGHVVWEAWNGPDRTHKYLVARTLSPEMAAAVAAALDGANADTTPWTPQKLGFFSRLAEGPPVKDTVTVEWSRGPWSIRMLAEYLKNGWDANDTDFESGTESQPSSPEKEKVLNMAATPGQKEKVSWLSRLCRWRAKERVADKPSTGVPGKCNATGGAKERAHSELPAAELPPPLTNGLTRVVPTTPNAPTTPDTPTTLTPAIPFVSSPGFPPRSRAAAAPIINRTPVIPPRPRAKSRPFPLPPITVLTGVHLPNSASPVWAETGRSPNRYAFVLGSAAVSLSAVRPTPPTEPLPKTPPGVRHYGPPESPSRVLKTAIPPPTPAPSSPAAAQKSAHTRAERNIKQLTIAEALSAHVPGHLGAVKELSESPASTVSDYRTPLTAIMAPRSPTS